MNQENSVYLVLTASYHHDIKSDLCRPVHQSCAPQAPPTIQFLKILDPRSYKVGVGIPGQSFILLSDNQLQLYV